LIVSPGALISQVVPLLVVAVFVTLGLIWPRVGGIALWTLAGVCALVFAFGLWRQAVR
jgi:hypothetical protein